MDRMKYLRAQCGSRLVTLEEFVPLGYVEQEPPRFVLRDRDRATGAVLVEIRFHYGRDARLEYSLRVRALLGDAPVRARRLREHARRELDRAQEHETTREGAVAVRWWDVAEHRRAARDRCLLRAQVADQNARRIMQEVTLGVTPVTPQNVTEGSSTRQN